MYMKYSNYYKALIVLTLNFIGLAVLTAHYNAPDLCAICCTLSFTLWFVSMMTPKNEKYKGC